MQKSLMEIFDETVEAYKGGLETRGSSKYGCKYLTPDGKMCAVGRCCIGPKPGWIGSANSIRTKDATFDLEEVLKPEYRGHNVDFWLDLQGFHDNQHYFTKEGYSQTGLNEIEEFKKRIKTGYYET